MLRFAQCTILLVGFVIISSAYATNCFDGVGSERLANRCLIAQINEKKLPPSLIALTDGRLKNGGYLNGLGVKPAGGGSYYGIQASPELVGYENINGGNPSGKLILGGFVFTGDPKLEKVRDTAIGASVDMWSRHIFGEGRHLDFSGRYFEGKGVSSEFSVNKTDLRACANSHLINWTYLDLCYAVGEENKLLDKDSYRTISISGSKVFYSSKFGSTGVRFTLENYLTDGFWQQRKAISGESISPFGFFSINVGAGDSENQRLAYKNQYGFSWAKNFGLNKVAIYYTNRYSDGGFLLGFPYSEKAESIVAAVNIGRSWLVSLGHVKNNNTIDYFDYSYPTFSVKYVVRIGGS